MPWDVSTEAGELRMNDRPLTRISDTRWKRGNDTYTFEGADKFRIDGFDGNLYEFVRTPAVALPVSQFGEYAGSYASPETMATYRITVEAGVLTLRIDGWPDTVLKLSASYRDAFLSDGMLIRFRRGSDGKINALSLGDSRMWDLQAARVK
jgi:hypothetical protein